MARLTLIVICSALVFACNCVDAQGIGAKVETTGKIETKLETKSSYPELTKTVIDEKKDASKDLTKTVVDEKKDDKKDDKKDEKTLTKTIVDEQKGKSGISAKEETKPKSRIARQAVLPAKVTTITYNLGKRVNGKYIK